MNQRVAMVLLAAAVLAGAHPAPSFAAEDAERSVKPVQFKKGSSSATLTGRIQGRQYVDYTLRGGAGQHVALKLEASSASAYVNLLPPGSPDAAMYIGQVGDNRFEGLLPDDGVYTLRVYLVRAAARRDAATRYTLTIAVTGKPLPPLSAARDALVAGTRYHAQATIACAPAYTQTKQCAAGVVRRGVDGSATVELRWDATRARRILFVKGSPVAADVPQPMKFTRDERGQYRIVFSDDERFDVPEGLVFGG